MVNSFINYLQYEKNYSQWTLRKYGDSLKEFEDFFHKKDDALSWQTIDSDIIRDWMEHLMDKGEKATTVCRKLSALRTFYKFALARHLVEKDPIHRILSPKKEKPLPQFVREEEMDRLLDDIKWEETFEGQRNRAILMTFYATGIRRAELIGLDDVMVDLYTKQLKVTGKRNKQRIIPFGDELFQALEHYLNLRKENINTTTPAFFQTKKGERMSENQVYKVVNEALTKVSSLKKRSPHVLRHTFATAMLNHEAGLESVQKLLGHASLATTEVYTHTTFEQLKRVYKEAHPRADVKPLKS